MLCSCGITRDDLLYLQQLKQAAVLDSDMQHKYLKCVTQRKSLAKQGQQAEVLKVQHWARLLLHMLIKRSVFYSKGRAVLMIYDLQYCVNIKAFSNMHLHLLAGDSAPHQNTLFYSWGE